MKRFDAKGKYYTDKVTTRPLLVRIQTVSGFVEGEMHIHFDQRLSDEVNNKDRGFLALTNATVHPQEGDSFFTGFLSLNKQQIVWIAPVEAINQRDE